MMRVLLLWLVLGWPVWGQVGASPKEAMDPRSYQALKQRLASEAASTAGQVNVQAAAIRRDSAGVSAQLAALSAQVAALSAVMAQKDMSRVAVLELEVKAIKETKERDDTERKAQHDALVGRLWSASATIACSALLSGAGVVLGYLRGRRQGKQVEDVRARLDTVRDRVDTVGDTVDGVSNDVHVLKRATDGMTERLEGFASAEGFRKGREAGMKEQGV